MLENKILKNTTKIWAKLSLNLKQDFDYLSKTKYRNGYKPKRKFLLCNSRSSKEYYELAIIPREKMEEYLKI